MLFSTKAEYGVRLMVELGRRAGSTAPEAAEPVALAAVAEAEMGLVTSVRGAHGGYRLAKPATEIAMIEVVEALEGPVAPMECFHADREGRVLCSHEVDADRACATKMLWTRVHGGVTKALRQTTLAELVEFAGPHQAGRTEPVAESVA